MSKWKNWDFILYIDSFTGTSENISKDIDVQSYNSLGGTATTSNFDLELPSITLSVFDIENQISLTYASSYREFFKKYKNVYLEIYYDNMSKKIFRGYLLKNSIKTQKKEGFQRTEFTFVSILSSLDKKIVNQGEANLSEIDSFVNNILNIFPSTELIYELDVVELPENTSYEYIKCQYNPDTILPKIIPNTSGILQLGKELLGYHYYDINPFGKEDVNDDGILENVIYFYPKNSYNPNLSENSRRKYGSILEVSDVSTVRILKVLYFNDVINDYLIDIDSEFLNKYIQSDQEKFSIISQNRCSTYSEAGADNINTQAFKKNTIYNLVDYNTVGIQEDSTKEYSNDFDDGDTDFNIPTNSNLVSYERTQFFIPVTNYKYSSFCPSEFKTILEEDNKIEYIYDGEGQIDSGQAAWSWKEIDYYLPKASREKIFLDFITTCDDNNTYYYISRDIKKLNNHNIYDKNIYVNKGGSISEIYKRKISYIYRYVIRDTDNNVKKIISTGYWIPDSSIKFYHFGYDLADFKLLWLDVENSSIDNITFHRRPTSSADTVLCNVLYKDGTLELYEVSESTEELTKVEEFLNNNTLIDSMSTNIEEIAHNNGSIQTADSITNESLFYITVIENDNGEYYNKKITFNYSGYGNRYNNTRSYNIESDWVENNNRFTGFNSIHLIDKNTSLSWFDDDKLYKIQYSYDLLDIEIKNKKATEILNFFRKFHLAMLVYNLKNNRLEIKSFSKMFDDFDGNTITLNSELTEEINTQQFNTDMIEISDEIASAKVKQYFQNYKMKVFNRFGEIRTLKTSDMTDVDYFDFIEFNGIVGVVIGKKIENEEGVANYLYQTLTLKQPYLLMQNRACGVML